MNIDKFKREHVEILGCVTDLRNLVQGGVAENADSIAKLLITMSATIKLHLATEDKVLYPALANSKDVRTAQLGRQFQAEMGDIAAAYTAFVAQWRVASKIAAEPEKFRADANAVFKALHQRVQRENQELYPLAERE